MKGKEWMIGAFAIVGLSGCGGCTDDGEKLKEQIIAQRNQDAKLGLFPPDTDPCNMSPATQAQVRALNPARVDEYAQACRRMNDQGCSL